MRAIVGIGCCAACSFPAGNEQTWPLEARVSAITSIDADSNRSSDLVVFADGTERTRGAYLFYQDSALALDRRRAIGRSFDIFSPLALSVRASAPIDDDRIAVVGNVATDAQLHVAILRITPDGLQEVSRTSLADSSVLPWVLPAEGSRGAMLLVGTESHVWSVGPDDPDRAPIDVTGPSGVWSRPRTGTLIRAADTDYLVVASATEAFRARVPPDGLDAIVAADWQRIREGSEWRTQVTVDLDGDQQHEIVGIESSNVCALNARALTPTIGCLPSEAARSVNVQLVAGSMNTSPRPDLLAIGVGPVVSTYERFLEVQLDGSTLSAETSPPATRAGQGPYHLALVTDPIQAPRLIVIDQAAHAYCVRVDGATISDCGP